MTGYSRAVATVVGTWLLLWGGNLQHGLADDNKAPATAELKGTIETDEPAKQPKDKIDGDLSITHHTATINGKKLDYTVSAGFLPLKSDAGKETAKVFHIAYTVDQPKEAAPRPLTFCFNGGPGSSSVWLHLGMLAPKRVHIADEAVPTRPPGKLIPNEYSLLDVTDLVFIDPVSTGYSRPADGEKKSQFHGYQEDISSVGEFIFRYTTRNARWMSEKYLLGESYGTLRAAGLSGHLQSRYRMELNGIVLISSVLDFQTLRFSQENDMAFILFLPSYTATAWYHKQLPDDLQKRPLKDVLNEVEKFTLDVYAPALFRGNALDGKSRKALIEQLSRYTGLSKPMIRRSNLRISMPRFGKELLRDKNRTVGRFDGRFLGIDREAAGDYSDYDASAASLFGAYTATLYHYLRQDLKVEQDFPYEILTGKVHPWNYSNFENRYVNSATTLRAAMTENPFLQVFVANGYYDLATPYFATEHTFRHLQLDASLRKNVHMGYYPAGHMMYVHEPSLKKLKTDLVKFYATATAE